MNYQIVIYSADVVFARMLELEFLARDKTVLVTEQYQDGLYSDVALLDLDSASAPPADRYGRMIGFTRRGALADDDTRRLCSMILHRPFEMRLLRREILGELPAARSAMESLQKQIKLSVNAEQSILLFDGQKIRLTPRELLVVQCLLSHRGNAVSRELLATVIGESSANKTDVYVCYLRRKLESVSQQKIIITVRNRGYMIP